MKVACFFFVSFWYGSNMSNSSVGNTSTYATTQKIREILGVSLITSIQHLSHTQKKKYHKNVQKELMQNITQYLDNC